MSPAKRDAKKQAKAGQRRRHKAQERLERDCRQAQQAAEALPQALEVLVPLGRHVARTSDYASWGECLGLS